MLPAIVLAVMMAVPLTFGSAAGSATAAKRPNPYNLLVAGNPDYIPQVWRSGYKVAINELTSGDNRGYEAELAEAVVHSSASHNKLTGMYLARADFSNIFTMAMDDKETKAVINQALFQSISDDRNILWVLRGGISDAVPTKIACAFTSRDKGTSYRDVAAIADGYFKVMTEPQKGIISGADHCPALYGISPIDIVTAEVRVTESMTGTNKAGKQKALTDIMITAIKVNLAQASDYLNATLGQAFMIGAILGRLERHYVYSEGGSNLETAIGQLSITGVDESLKLQVREAILKGYNDNHKLPEGYSELRSKAKKSAEGPSGGSASGTASPRG